MKAETKRLTKVVIISVIISSTLSLLISYNLFVHQSGKFCKYEGNIPLGVNLNDKKLRCSAYRKADDILYDDSSISGDVKELKNQVSDLENNNSKLSKDIESLESRVQDLEK